MFALECIMQNGEDKHLNKGGRFVNADLPKPNLDYLVPTRTKENDFMD
jgi:hypothetical protein